MTADKRTIAALKMAYTILADMRHQWPGRHTAEGQGALSAMRDAIAKNDNIDPCEVQDAYAMASTIARPVTKGVTEWPDAVMRLPALEAEVAKLREERAELVAALRFLYDEVCSLEDYTVTRDIDKYKAEANMDDAVNTAHSTLARLGSAA